MMLDEASWRCFVCGEIATALVRVAGEDEPLTEEAVCERHAQGHWRSALLGAPDSVDPPTVPAGR